MTMAAKTKQTMAWKHWMLKTEILSHCLDGIEWYSDIEMQVQEKMAHFVFVMGGQSRVDIFQDMKYVV